MFSIADVVQMAVVNRRAVFLLFLLFLGSISAISSLQNVWKFPPFSPALEKRLNERNLVSRAS